MISEKELSLIENELTERGIDDNLRQNVRNSKICMIDDGIEDLKGLFKGLENEGFTNIQKLKKINSLNDILNQKNDLILLDLNDVAKDIDEDDGLGILEKIKLTAPEISIIIITGQKISADKAHIINKADLVLNKPVKASNLAWEIEKILLIRYDKFWTSLKVLREIRKIDMDIKDNLGYLTQLRYVYTRRQLEKNLLAHDNKVIKRLETLHKILKLVVPTANKIVNILDVLKIIDKK